jgi:hypothetical protein
VTKLFFPVAKYQHFFQAEPLSPVTRTCSDSITQAAPARSFTSYRLTLGPRGVKGQAVFSGYPSGKAQILATQQKLRGIFIRPDLAEVEADPAGVPTATTGCQGWHPARAAPAATRKR